MQLDPAQELALKIPNRAGYLHLINGSVNVNESVVLNQGDGLGGLAKQQLNLNAGSSGVTALWFDLPPIN